MSEESKPIAPGGASPDEHNCAICRAWMFLEEGAEWSGDGDDVCNHCAQDELVRLRASLSTAEKEIARLREVVEDARIRLDERRIMLDEKEALIAALRRKNPEGRFGTHYETIPHSDCQDPRRCDCECAACMTAHAALSRSNVGDAPTAPKASDIASDSSALEKALGALRRIAGCRCMSGLLPCECVTCIAREALSGGAHVDALKAQKEEEK